jgi:hypothetical protein
LNPFPASFYRRALRDARHSVFPNNVFMRQFTIRLFPIRFNRLAPPAKPA